MKVAIYARVSTTRQAEGEISLPDQIAQCEAYCARQGWTVAATFVEPGASDRDDDRPQFQEMIHQATRPDRPFAAIVVHSLSRFSRDSVQAGIYTNKLEKMGVRLVSITQDVGDTDMGAFVRKILHLMDEHQSLENAKHVHRSMLENARQGFWNGSTAPFGYSTHFIEKRGARDKKRLVIHEGEAATVRKIFDLALGVDAPPMGGKAIAVHLSARGVTRRGKPLSTGSVYEILTSETYAGTHYFNRTDTRKKVRRPPSEWIAVPVPAIIDARAFNQVQALLQSRNAKVVPPRVVNGPTFLAGLAKCGYCGLALIQNTGKGGRYRYYCCSKKLKQGLHSCRGLRMPMDALDKTVLDYLEKHVLPSSRLEGLLADYIAGAENREAHAKDALAQRRAELTDTNAAITRLLELVEKGVMDMDDAAFRDRMVKLRFRRDELADEINTLNWRLSAATPAITPEKIKALSDLLRAQFRSEDPKLRQSYAKVLPEEVRVTDTEIRITGSKKHLADQLTASNKPSAPEVLSFVQKWRTRRDSNP
jgi:site-specific DNA recombinase